MSDVDRVDYGAGYHFATLTWKPNYNGRSLLTMGDSTFVPPGVSCPFHPYHILLDGYNADIEEKRNRSTHRKVSERIGLEREESPRGGARYAMYNAPTAPCHSIRSVLKEPPLRTKDAQFYGIRPAVSVAKSAG